MKPTNQTGGRGGDACQKVQGIEDALGKARRLFAALSTKLEDEIDQLQFVADDTKGNQERLKDVNNLITTVRAALQTVLNIEDKLAGHGPAKVSQAVVIDLDEARAEIESRLARLVA